MASPAPPATTARVAIIQASNVIDDVSVRAADKANYPVFDAAESLRLLIDTLRLSLANKLEAPPHELNTSQREMLNQIRARAALLQKAVEEPVTQARRDLEEHRGPSPQYLLSSGRPAVESIFPYVLAPSASDTVRFTIRGTRLDKGNPRLFFGETEATRVELDRQHAVFSVPTDVLKAIETKPAVYSGRLILGVKQCGWRPFCNPVTREYTVRSLLLPSRLADVEISFRRKGSQRVYDMVSDSTGASEAPGHPRLYSRTFEYANEDLTLLSCNTERQVPHAPGYLIDTDALIASVKTSTGETRWSLMDSSPEGFKVSLCAQAQMSQMMQTKGFISVQVTWTEYRVSDAELPSESLPRRALRWREHLHETLPADISSIAVTLDYFDGSHSTFTADGTDEYVDMKWSPVTRDVDVIAHEPAADEIVRR